MAEGGEDISPKEPLPSAISHKPFALVMRTTRRDILGRLGFGLTFLPALALAPRSVVGSLLFEPDGPLVPAKPIPPNLFVRDGKALVAMIHGQDPAAMLQAGLELLGGIDRVGARGKRVLIKPNVVNDRPPPSTTSPQVIVAAVKSVREAGAADVVVADSSGIIRFPTTENFVATGIRAAAESAGARVLALEDEPWVRVEPAGAKSLPRFYVSKPVYDADVFINLPVVKTHRFAHYSCSLKNLVGITHPRYRPSVTFLAGVDVVPRGSWVTLQRKHVETGRYFDIGVDLVRRPEAEHADAVRSALFAALRRQTAQLDVIGLGLSGGLDSALVLAGIRHVAPAKVVHTFTVGHGDEDREIIGARETARNVTSRCSRCTFMPSV